MSNGQGNLESPCGPQMRTGDLFKQAPQPLAVFDYESLQFVAVNLAAIEGYGYSESEFVGMNVCDLAAPDNQTTWAAAVAAARETGELEPHWQHRKKDGTIIEVELAARNLSYNGREACLLLCADVTERKAVELQTIAFSELGRRLSAARTP